MGLFSHGAGKVTKNEQRILSAVKILQLLYAETWLYHLESLAHSCANKYQRSVYEFPRMVEVGQVLGQVGAMQQKFLSIFFILRLYDGL